MARLRFHMRLILIAASVLVVTGAALGVWDSDTPFWEWNSKIEIKRDRQPRWQVDPNQPFEITVRDFGMPSCTGSDVTVYHDGRLVAKRERLVWTESPPLRKETATTTISPDAIASILDAIESNRVMRLHSSYTRTDTFDGIVWTVVIKQGDREKVVSCRNHFPDSFMRFWKQLETIVSPDRVGLKWQEVRRAQE